MSYQSEIRSMVAREAGDIKPGAVTIEIDGNFVIINWPTSMLNSDVRATVKAKAQELLPAHMKGYRVSIT